MDRRSIPVQQQFFIAFVSCDGITQRFFPFFGLSLFHYEMPFIDWLLNIVIKFLEKISVVFIQI